MSEIKKHRVFVSYAHEDEAFKEALNKHLTMLRRSSKIELWTDRALTPGLEWDAEIRKQLEAADIILLLVSAAFLASDYIWRVELSHAMERHQAGTALVIPIILKPCDWHDAPFGILQSLPKNAKPIADVGNDSAWLDVASAIKKVVT